MNTLVSPGVSVTVVDESAYASPGFGTIPLIVIATAQDKVDPTGTESDGIAKYTKAVNANRVVPVTSQRELTQFFGDAIFAQGEGMETSEYGLLAAYSYLGQGSQAYIVRAGVDLAELEPSETEPTGPANGNQIWLDTDGSSFGVHVYNAASDAWILQDVVVEVDLSAGAGEIANPSTYAPTASVGTAGDFLVAVISDGTTGFAVGYFYSDGSAWEAVTQTNAAALAATTVSYDTHYNTPASPANADIWVKTTRPGNGVNLVVYQSNSLGVFGLLEVAGVSNDGGTTYVAQDGSSVTDIVGAMDDNDIALTFTAADGGFEIRRIESGSETVLDEAVYAQDDEPTGTAIVGKYWYDPTVTDLDILIHDGTDWSRIAEADITYSTTEPLTPSADDIWVETDGTDAEYPKIHRYTGTQWVLYDNSDQTTERGVIFDDFTVTDRATLASGAVNTTDLLDSAPDPQLYPTDMG